MAKLRALIAAKSASAKFDQDKRILNVPPDHDPLASAVREVAQGAHELARDKVVIYNERQSEFIDTVYSGKSCALIGPAGTGKTTSTKGAILKLIESGKAGQLDIADHKYLIGGTPGIICTSFTNKAVQNLKKVLPLDLQKNCLTVHKLLEFCPEFYEVWDEKESKYKKTMKFEPKRNENNRLPASIKTIIIDEASMLDGDLWNQLFDALPLSGVQVILIGDIEQLPPVFGKSIFIYALQAGIPRVELTEVYRQALESPIISLATHIRQGKMITAKDLQAWNIDKLAEGNGKLTILPWKKAFSVEAATVILCKKLTELIRDKQLHPFEDTILCPWNVKFGCIEFNNAIAQYLAHSEEWNPQGNPVYEIISGIKKKYYRVGDKVLWNKTEHVIRDIKANPDYFGKPFQIPSTTLGYDGVERDPAKQDALANALLENDELGAAHIASIDHFLDQFAGFGEDKDEKSTNAASHCITVYSEEFDSEETISSAGDVNNLDLGYCITVHKSQGSEYRRVFFVTHKAQANMLFRELIYTACTRAKEELVVICEPNLFVAGVTSQRLPGKNLEDKIAQFDRLMQITKGVKHTIPKGLWMFDGSGAKNLREVAAHVIS
jgi:ATP-dependent exoDNAse (exonuclease V) alpha subunit